jgi:hypothetical protein
MSNGINRAVKEIYSEFKLKNVQAAAELAQALFSGSNAYVPYGRGQGAAKDHDHEKPAQGEEHGVHGKEEPQQERGGREI